MKKLNPKKLNIEEMWKMYQALEPAVNDKITGTLLDESRHIMDNIPPHEFIRSLYIMYQNRYKDKNPIEVSMMFMNGLLETKFFVFTEIIRKLSHGSSRK